MNPATSARRRRTPTCPGIPVMPGRPVGGSHYVQVYYSAMGAAQATGTIKLTPCVGPGGEDSVKIEFLTPSAGRVDELVVSSSGIRETVTAFASAHNLQIVGGL